MAESISNCRYSHVPSETLIFTSLSLLSLRNRYPQYLFLNRLPICRHPGFPSIMPSEQEWNAGIINKRLIFLRFTCGSCDSFQETEVLPIQGWNSYLYIFDNIDRVLVFQHYVSILRHFRFVSHYAFRVFVTLYIKIHPASHTLAQLFYIYAVSSFCKIVGNILNISSFQKLSNV